MRDKLNLFYCLLTICVFIFSCSKDDGDKNEKVTIDFEIIVEGESPDATVTIVNNTTGAGEFTWVYGEGANVETSNDENPDNILVDKAGEFTVTLKASNNSQNDSLTKSITIEGESAIVTFLEVEFALNANDNIYGRLFSTETGIIYKDDETNESVSPIIDLAFGSMGNTMYFFESPDEEKYDLPNAGKTKVNNYQSALSVDDFDSMTDDGDLDVLTINDTNESFSNSMIPCVILFENSAGKKGAIKAHAVNSERMLVDIKIQKY